MDNPELIAIIVTSAVCGGGLAAGIAKIAKALKPSSSIVNTVHTGGASADSTLAPPAPPVPVPRADEQWDDKSEKVLVRDCRDRHDEQERRLGAKHTELVGRVGRLEGRRGRNDS